MLAVIGDVHGSIKTLKKLYYTLMDKYLIHRIVFLGDIVDRGLYSKEVVEFLMDRQGECLMTFLCGNHEDMLINSIENEKRYPNFCWHERVGLNTVASFMGITIEEAAKKTQWEITPYFLPYMEFFNGFQEYYIEHTKKYKFLLSHAGPAFFDTPPHKQYEKCSKEEKNRHYPYMWHTKTKKYYNSNDQVMWSVSVRGTFIYTGNSSKCTATVFTTCPESTWRIILKTTKRRI